MKHNKLVRDKIPDIIKRGGDRPVVRVLDAGEYERALKRKLQEEVEEFVESGRVEELVDVLEVVYAPAGIEGIGRDRLEGMREAKRRERGGFERKVFPVEYDRGHPAGRSEAKLAGPGVRKGTFAMACAAGTFRLPPFCLILYSKVTG